MIFEKWVTLYAGHMASYMTVKAHRSIANARTYICIECPQIVYVSDIFSVTQKIYHFENVIFYIQG